MGGLFLPADSWLRSVLSAPMIALCALPRIKLQTAGERVPRRGGSFPCSIRASYFQSLKIQTWGARFLVISVAAGMGRPPKIAVNTYHVPLFHPFPILAKPETADWGSSPPMSENPEMGTQFFQPVSYGPPAEGGWQLLAWMSYRWLGSSSPVPKGEGPGAPSFGLDKVAGTGATRRSFTSSDR